VAHVANIDIDADNIGQLAAGGADGNLQLFTDTSGLRPNITGPDNPALSSRDVKPDKKAS
jgi:hypothetical protein